MSFAIALVGFLWSPKAVETFIERRLLTLVFDCFERRNFKLANQRHADADAHGKAWVSNLFGLFARASYGLKQQAITDGIPRFFPIGSKMTKMFHAD